MCRLAKERSTASSRRAHQRTTEEGKCLMSPAPAGGHARWSRCGPENPPRGAAAHCKIEPVHVRHRTRLLKRVAIRCDSND